MKKGLILSLFVICVILSSCRKADTKEIQNIQKDKSEPITAEDEKSVEDIQEELPATDNQEKVINEEVNQEEEKTEEDKLKETEGSGSVTDQIQLIVDNRDLWVTYEEYANDMYGYALTDLNNNERLEIIASNMGGTGIYSYTKIYEVNENYDGLDIYDYMNPESESQVDIINESTYGYYDASKDVIYLIYVDFLKSSAAEYYESKRAIYLEDGQIKEIPLAYKSTIYSDAVSDPVITYKNADQNDITEEDYKTIDDKYFADLEKKKVNIGWFYYYSFDEVENLGQKDWIDLLTKSYEAFAIE